MKKHREKGGFRGISPVIGIVILVGITVVLVAGATYFFAGIGDTKEPAPRVVVDTTTGGQGCSILVVEGSDADGVVYLNGLKSDGSPIDSDGDGVTEAGERVYLPPGENQLFAAPSEDTTYSLQKIEPVASDCVAAPTNPVKGSTSGWGGRYDVKYYGGSGTVGNSLNEIKVTAESGSGIDFSGVTKSDVELVGYDRDNDPDMDKDATFDLQSVSTSNGGRTIQLQLTGNTDVKKGDEILYRLNGGVKFNKKGTYKITVNINGDVTQSRNVTIESGS